MSQSEPFTEEKIFRAATEVFVEKGLDGARMQDIADRAGINKALLHYYFRSKEKLFDAVFDNLSETLLHKFASIFSEDMTFEKKLAYFFEEHISFLQRNEGLPLFILGEIAKRDDLLERFIKKINFQNIKENILTDSKIKLSDRMVVHLMISVISLSVFPVAARPLLKGIMDQQGIDYNEIIEERKSFSPAFVMNAISGFMNNGGIK